MDQFFSVPIKQLQLFFMVVQIIRLLNSISKEGIVNLIERMDDFVIDIDVFVKIEFLRQVNRFFCTELQKPIKNKIMKLGRLSSFLLVFACFCCDILAKQRQLPAKVLQELVNNHEKQFGEFKGKYKKRYSNPSEELYRNLVFFRNEKKIKKHNLDIQASYMMELNQFADLDEDEFRLTYANLIMPDQSVRMFAKNVEEKVNLQREDCLCKVQNQFKQLQLKAKIKLNKDVVNRKKFQYYSSRQIQFQKQENKVFSFPKQLLSLPEDQYEVIQQKLDPNRPDYKSSKKTTNSQTNPPSPPKTTLTDLFNQYNPPQQIPQNKNSATIDTTNKATQQAGTNTQSPKKQNLAKQPLQKDLTKVTDTTEKPQSLEKTTVNQKKIDPITNNKQQNIKTTVTNTGTEQSNVQGGNQISNPRRLLIEDLSQYNSDWTAYAGEARTQGLCGACYAFAAVQNLESILAIYVFDSVIELSVQQIIDCSGYTNLTLGCNGGYLEGPYVYLKNYGITTSYSYPYTSGTSGTSGQCKTQQGMFKIASYKSLPFRNCTALREVLKKKPVSVAIASYRLQFYRSGVFTDCNSYIDHAVVVVAYQYQKGWKIKNSWGRSWGQNGFAWLADGNSCALCDYPMVPKIDLQPSDNP